MYSILPYILSILAGALNDSFLIWQQGPFATINGFRLGRLDTHLVDWQEVNAGVGQAAIILVTGDLLYLRKRENLCR